MMDHPLSLLAIAFGLLFWLKSFVLSIHLLQIWKRKNRKSPLELGGVITVSFESWCLVCLCLSGAMVIAGWTVGWAYMSRFFCRLPVMIITQPTDEISKQTVSYWLVGIRTLSSYRPSRVGEQPLRLRRDARILMTCMCRWRWYAVTQDRTSFYVA
jgi:hypothetical protein